jgi:hypothetical protein
VDRFGQQRAEVHAITLWGRDSEIDQVVLEVLIRKARTIRSALGIAVPVPREGERIIDAVVDNVLLRRATGKQMSLGLATPVVKDMHEQWDRAAERESKERAYYSQQGIQPDEVTREIEATDRVLGDSEAVHQFLDKTVQRFSGAIERKGKDGVFLFKPGDLAARIPTVDGVRFPARVTFDRLVDPDALYLGRTHPVVEETAQAVLGRAFSSDPGPLFARAGASFTEAVKIVTAVLLLRIRYVIREKTRENFAEEVLLAAFEPAGEAIRWLEPIVERAKAILFAPLTPVNMELPERRDHVRRVLELVQGRPVLFEPLLASRRKEIREAQNRLRSLLKANEIDVRSDGPDILGCYVMVPASPSSR